MCDNSIGLGVAAISAALEVFRNVISFLITFMEGNWNDANSEAGKYWRGMEQRYPQQQHHQQPNNQNVDRMNVQRKEQKNARQQATSKEVPSSHLLAWLRSVWMLAINEQFKRSFAAVMEQIFSPNRVKHSSYHYRYYYVILICRLSSWCDPCNDFGSDVA